MSEEKSPSSLLAAIATIDRILSGLSKKEAKEALMMVSVTRDLRIISMNRPIGLPVTFPPKTESQASGRKATPKAPWKSDSRWSEMNKIHTDLVNQIKDESSAIAKDHLIELLRQHEFKMKALKHQLQGFHQPA
jgi:hypothetical protein